MNKLNFDEVLIKISKDIINAKNRIYATHLIKTEEDFNLPIVYINALKSSKCKNKKRVIFGDKELFNYFNNNEKYFKNHFSNKIYFRMLLIDDKLYFKYQDNFYMTKEKDIICLFEGYFSYIN
ncbi:MAG: hypothetical protein PHH06_00985 [Candidatus Gracilibacteria bacterium]|nr:hypothetical protein [Candidatus Gracilibacteria bacterium]